MKIKAKYLGLDPKRHEGNTVEISILDESKTVIFESKKFASLPVAWDWYSNKIKEYEKK